MDSDKLSRRTFVRKTSLLTAGTVAGTLAGGRAAFGEAVKPPDTSTILNYNPKMGYRRLGRAGPMVSEISVGGHNSTLEKRHQYYPGVKIIPEAANDLRQYGDYYDERTRQVACALDAGVNFFDPTNDREVRSLSVALARLGRRDDCYICGDFLRGRYHDEKTPDDLRTSLVEHINKTIRVLKTDRVDLLRITTFESWSMEDLAAGIAGFGQLKSKGKARWFGISSHDPEYITNVVNHFDEIDFIVTPYSFAHRLAEVELFPRCHAKGIGIITIKPFHGGAFFLPPSQAKKEPSGYKTTPSADMLERMDPGEGESLAQANLRYILFNPHLTATIPGVNSRREVIENTMVAGQGRKRRPDTTELQRHAEAAHRVLPPEYQWLDRWHAAPLMLT